MEKLTKRLLYIIPFMVLAMVLGACDDDDDETVVTNKDYYGEWESNPYPTFNLKGDTILERMVFTFTNTTFEDLIYQTDSSDFNPANLTLASGMKGIIANPADGELEVEIVEMSIGGTLYINKEDDPETFATTFNNSLGLMLYEEFDANYIIDGSSMQLIIPIKIPGTTITTTDTLNLTKVTE